MAKKAELKAVLTLNNSKFARTLVYSAQLAKRFARQLAANPVKTLGLTALVGTEKGLILASSAAAAFKLVATAALTVVAKRAIEAAAQLEVMKVGFEVLLGSAEKANQRVASLQKFALKTPFDLPEIAQASRELEVMTEGALSGVKSLEMIGNVASGVQRNFGDVALEAGRLYASLRSGQPVGEELNSLMKMGAISHPGKMRIQRLVDAGTPRTMAMAWKEVTNEFARFTGQSQKMAMTWQGTVVQLKDTIRMTFASAGDPIIKELTPAVHQLMEEMLANQALFKDIGKTFAADLKAGIDYVTDTLNRGSKIGFGKKLMLDIGSGVEDVLSSVTDMLPSMLQGALKLTPGAIVGKAIENKSFEEGNTGARSFGAGKSMEQALDKIDSIKTIPKLLPLLVWLGNLQSIKFGNPQLASGKLGKGLPESITSSRDFEDRLGQAPRRNTPFLRFAERRAIDNQRRATEMALRYTEGNYSGRAAGDTQVRRGDRKRMFAVLREQARKEQQALTNKTFEEFIKKFDTFTKQMGGS